MAIPTPDATELAGAFDLGTPLTPPERIASGWGGHNQLWRLRTSRGTWAVKEVGRDLSLDPDDTLALERAAYTDRGTDASASFDRRWQVPRDAEWSALWLPRMGRRHLIALARPCTGNSGPRHSRTSSSRTGTM